MAIIPLYLWCLITFLLPGFAGIMLAAARREVRTTYAVILMVVSGGVIGYIAFWMYFANRTAGRAFSFVVASLSVLIACVALARSRPSRTLALDIARPFAYVAVIGAFYVSILFCVSDPFKIGQDLADWRFFTPLRPGDNIIPWLFASKIYHRQPLIPFCCGDWLSSDRPPLQAGICLFNWPFRLLGSEGLQYQLLASGLQCLWVGGVWVLLKTLRASDLRITQALGLLVPSAFLLYNSVYTWPKLLAATFILFAVVTLVTAFLEGRSLTIGETILGTLCIGLALMAHPGSVFSLVAFGAAVVLKRSVPWRGLACSMLILICFGAPWAAYQKYFDPPGNRLMKMHLAGAVAVDSRTTWRALRDSYASVSLKGVLTYKWTNITHLIGPEPVAGFGLNALHWDHGLHMDPAALESARVAQREYIWSAIGILNIGWLAITIALLRKKKPAIPSSGWMILAALTNLIIWAVVMFGPSATPTTHASYADILLIMLGLSGFLLASPRWVPACVMVLETLNLVIVWLQFRPESGPVHTVIQWPLLISGILLFCAMLWYLGRSFFTAETAERAHRSAAASMGA